jgi:hypothetical protein
MVDALTTHNRLLYVDIPLDRTILDSYPDNDLLPGMPVEHRISGFQDHNLDSSDTFAEETTGFTEHPAQTIKLEEDNERGASLLLQVIEKMGVSDPEGTKSESAAVSLRLQL